MTFLIYLQYFMKRTLKTDKITSESPQTPREKKKIVQDNKKIHK